MNAALLLEASPRFGRSQSRAAAEQVICRLKAREPALRVLRRDLAAAPPPLIDEAFTEAMYLLGRSWAGQRALWSRLETEALTLAPLDESDAPRMRELMEKYRNLPMDLADAALVRVAERDALAEIFTLDHRHFSVYRPGRRRRFSVVPG